MIRAATRCQGGIYEYSIFGMALLAHDLREADVFQTLREPTFKTVRPI
jgi:hypothetical protein